MKATVPHNYRVPWQTNCHGAKDARHSIGPFNAGALNGGRVVRNIASATLAVPKLNCSSHINPSAATPDACQPLVLAPRKLEAQPFAKDLDGRILEDAFWENSLINGHTVTARDILTQYRTDRNSSLRAGFFLQSLFHNKVLCDQQRISPDHIVAEFNRAPDYQKKYLLAIARFKQICCKQHLSLAGVPVTPEHVLAAFPNSPDGILAMAHFLSDRCLHGKLLHGRPVIPQTVIKVFQAVNAKLDLTRFKASCFERGLPLNGHPFNPDAIVADFLAVHALLELAHFMETCCLNGDKINGHPVAAEEVISGYQAVDAKLELALFKQQCCLKKIKCNGQLIMPEIVLDDFPDNHKGRIAATRFKAKCCQRGLRLNGQRVTTETVVGDFQALGAIIELARFLEHCCLTGRPIHGRPVLPEMVIEQMQKANAGLDLAHFLEQCCLKGLYAAMDKQKQPALISADEVFRAFIRCRASNEALSFFKTECCLRGLLLDGQLVDTKMVLSSLDKAASANSRSRFKANCHLKGLYLDRRRVTAESVLGEFPQSLQGQHAMVRFKSQCCLHGHIPGEQPITPEEVLASFPTGQKGQLARARFTSEACLLGLHVHGQLITAEATIQEFQQIREGGLIGIARFKTECCLRGLPLYGQQVTPEEVLVACQKADAPLELARFKEECCLNGWQLNGRSVTPEEVVRDYAQRAWKLERAIFIARLAQHGLCLYGNRVDDAQVLATYDSLMADQSVRKTEYLILRLNNFAHVQASVEANLILNQAWQIIECSGTRDDHSRHLRCLLMLLARRYGLTLGIEQPSLEQVWTSVNTLRNSFSKTCLHFFFLVFCRHAGHAFHGQQVQEEQIISILDQLPGQLRYALECWLDGRYYNPPYQNNRLFKLLIQLPFLESCSPANQPDFAGQHENIDSGNTQSVHQWPSLVQPSLTMPAIGQPATTVLDIVNDINKRNNHPVLLINGSFSHYLQGISPTFKDVDIIGTEESIKQLSDQLATVQMRHETGSGLLVRPIPGCARLQLPDSMRITGTGHTEFGIQACICSRVMPKDVLAVHLPGENKPVMCLSFISETALMNENVTYLTENLDLLTDQLYDDASFIVPRTIVFNYPQTTEERVFGLLMRCLMTLNKAKQFQSTLATGQAVFYGEQAEVALDCLQKSIACLLVKLRGHSHHNQFVATLEQRISDQQTRNDYLDKQRGFIGSLLGHLNEGSWP